MSRISFSPPTAKLADVVLPGVSFAEKDGKFTRGKGLFHTIAYNPPAEVVDDEYPFWMTTGRVYALPF